MTDLLRTTGAHFSPCRTWRMRLWRIWDPTLPVLAMGMLNPSKADEAKNDPTVERVERRAFKAGYGGLIVWNAHAYVATDPDDMKARHREGVDIVGPENMAHIRAIMIEVHGNGGRVCVRWGVDGGFVGQDRAISALADELDVPLYCLGTTKDGHPRHPLYVGYAQGFERWSPR